LRGDNGRQTDDDRQDVQMTVAHELTEKPPKMLIADDDAAIVRLLAERCTSVGFEVETATNGVQALLKAKRSHPDIVVIDVNMPEADGLTVCARLLDPSKRPLDVIVVTGSRETETLERCEGFGAFYVRKGPEFWSGLGAALTAIFPHMADSISELQGKRVAAEIRERPRALVIDNDLAVKQLLSSRLEKSGVKMLFASDVGQGFRLACREAPSVIVSDYFFPNGGVAYLLSRLRTTSITENIPVLVFTEWDLDEITVQSLMREVCGKPGVAQIFKKSFDLDELFGALQKLCGLEYNRAYQ
jgi:CheY-like chemotaxis protein